MWQDLFVLFWIPLLCGDKRAKANSNQLLNYDSSRLSYLCCLCAADVELESLQLQTPCVLQSMSTATSF